MTRDNMPKPRDNPATVAQPTSDRFWRGFVCGVVSCAASIALPITALWLFY